MLIKIGFPIIRKAFIKWTLNIHKVYWSKNRTLWDSMTRLHGGSIHNMYKLKSAIKAAQCWTFNVSSSFPSATCFVYIIWQNNQIWEWHDGCLQMQPLRLKRVNIHAEWESPAVPWCVLAAAVSGEVVLVAVVSGSPYKGTEGWAGSCVT